MMPILLGRGSAGISHNIAQACQASLFTFLSVLRGRCPIGAEEEGCSQSACRFQIIVLQKSPLWLPPPRPSSVRPELSHVGISVVSTEARRAERRDLLSSIGRLSWRGLSAPRLGQGAALVIIDRYLSYAKVAPCSLPPTTLPTVSMPRSAASAVRCCRTSSTAPATGVGP